MKCFFLIVLWIISCDVFSSETTCAEITKEDVALLRSNNYANNHVLSEYVFTNKLKDKRNYNFKNNNEIKISIAEAKKMISMGLVVEVFINSSGDVWMHSNSGKTYTSKEDKPNELGNVVLEVDPCLNWITLQEQ